MPELPEVETIARDLSRYLLNRPIVSVKIFSAKTVSPGATVFRNCLVGRKITKIGRRGKLLILHLSPLVASARRSARTPSRDYLLIHLKMTGQLIYLDQKNKVAGGHSLSPRKTDSLSVETGWTAAVGGTLPNKYTRAVINFTRGGHLFFNDLRKFGYLKLVTTPELEKLLKNNYGPEPLTPAFSLAAFLAILKNKTAKIKALLLDQKFIAGLGNIYVDESLYAARLKPTRRAGSLTLAEAKTLRLEINRIIKMAIKQRGTTFSDYVDSQGRPGNFSRFLRVYGRAGEKCRNCGRPILKTKVAGRGTHYCSFCQN